MLLEVPEFWRNYANLVFAHRDGKSEDETVSSKSLNLNKNVCILFYFYFVLCQTLKKEFIFSLASLRNIPISFIQGFPMVSHLICLFFLRLFF